MIKLQKGPRELPPEGTFDSLPRERGEGGESKEKEYALPRELRPHKVLTTNKLGK